MTLTNFDRKKMEVMENALREIEAEAGRTTNGADDYSQGYIDGLSEAAAIASSVLNLKKSCINYPCNHPRTPENTKPHGNGMACRICRRVIEQRAQAKRRLKP